jgi:hypothetical protein
MYNYDFEFELAGLPPVVFGHSQISPWSFLNRSASFLIPFAKTADYILTYQKPPEVVLSLLKQKLGHLPQFIELELIKQESNSIITDVETKYLQPFQVGQYALSPWGWSPKTIDLAADFFANRFPPDFSVAVKKANSKQTSDSIRNQLLAQSFAIPSLQVTKKTISPEELKHLITRFISQYPQCKIKHYFGASGKLSDSVNLTTLSEKKLAKWQSWIAQSGGLLIEESLNIESEFSIQAEIESADEIRPIALTQLYSNSNGSYLGNLIDRTQQPMLDAWMEQFKPLFTHIAEFGYQGPIGLDLVRTTTQETKLLEINARLTMGRVAYQWNRALHENKIGFFSNFLVKNTEFVDIKRFVERCSRLETEFDCSISIINFIHSKQNSSSLISLLIGANTKMVIRQVLEKINQRIFQSINL